jgi:hypothetical protein
MTKLTPQTPAEGISTAGLFSDNDTMFRIACSCMDDQHAVIAWIEVGENADWPEPCVSFYVNATYPGWNGFWRRFKDAFKIIIGREVTREHTLLLTNQSAVNFAQALTDSIKDRKTL